MLLSPAALRAEKVTRFAVITDIHHTDKADSATRRYSAALGKVEYFVNYINSISPRPRFCIELGDYVDFLDQAGGKDPVVNLLEVECLLQQFKGGVYHTLGNHEFDNVTRAQLLPNIPNTGIPVGQTYYSFDVGWLHCIVLDADYTNDPPHIPFDMEVPPDDWWTWKDAYIPEAEMEWLAADLAAADKPTVVFTHQTLNRADTQDHNIKNASAVRALFEADGQVLAAFSGHDHQGDHAEINGIHYFVLNGNVGITDNAAIGWDGISPTGGYDPVMDNQFSIVEIEDEGNVDGLTSYRISVEGHGWQVSYDKVAIALKKDERPRRPGQE
jgi:alkaline phosphatase